MGPWHSERCDIPVSSATRRNARVVRWSDECFGRGVTVATNNGLANLTKGATKVAGFFVGDKYLYERTEYRSLVPLHLRISARVHRLSFAHPSLDPVATRRKLVDDGGGGGGASASGGGGFTGEAAAITNLAARIEAEQRRLSRDGIVADHFRRKRVGKIARKRGGPPRKHAVKGVRSIVVKRDGHGGRGYSAFGPTGAASMGYYSASALQGKGSRLSKSRRMRSFGKKSSKMQISRHTSQSTFPVLEGAVQLTPAEYDADDDPALTAAAGASGDGNDFAEALSYAGSGMAFAEIVTNNPSIARMGRFLPEIACRVPNSSVAMELTNARKKVRSTQPFVVEAPHVLWGNARDLLFKRVADEGSPFVDGRELENVVDYDLERAEGTESLMCIGCTIWVDVVPDESRKPPPFADVAKDNALNAAAKVSRAAQRTNSILKKASPEKIRRRNRKRRESESSSVDSEVGSTDSVGDGGAHVERRPLKRDERVVTHSLIERLEQTSADDDAQQQQQQQQHTNSVDGGQPQDETDDVVSNENEEEKMQSVRTEGGSVSFYIPQTPHSDHRQQRGKSSSIISNLRVIGDGDDSTGISTKLKAAASSKTVASDVGSDGNVIVDDAPRSSSTATSASNFEERARQRDDEGAESDQQSPHSSAGNLSTSDTVHRSSNCGHMPSYSDGGVRKSISESRCDTTGPGREQSGLRSDEVDGPSFLRMGVSAADHMSNGDDDLARTENDESHQSLRSLDREASESEIENGPQADEGQVTQSFTSASGSLSMHNEEKSSENDNPQGPASEVAQRTTEEGAITPCVGAGTTHEVTDPRTCTEDENRGEGSESVVGEGSEEVVIRSPSSDAGFKDRNISADSATARQCSEDRSYATTGGSFNPRNNIDRPEGSEEIVVAREKENVTARSKGRGHALDQVAVESTPSEEQGKDNSFSVGVPTIKQEPMHIAGAGADHTSSGVNDIDQTDDFSTKGSHVEVEDPLVSNTRDPAVAVSTGAGSIMSTANKDFGHVIEQQGESSVSDRNNGANNIGGVVLLDTSPNSCENISSGASFISENGNLSGGIESGGEVSGHETISKSSKKSSSKLKRAVKMSRIVRAISGSKKMKEERSSQSATSNHRSDAPARPSKRDDGEATGSQRSHVKLVAAANHDSGTKRDSEEGLEAKRDASLIQEKETVTPSVAAEDNVLAARMEKEEKKEVMPLEKEIDQSRTLRQSSLGTSTKQSSGISNSGPSAENTCGNKDAVRDSEDAASFQKTPNGLTDNSHLFDDEQQGQGVSNPVASGPTWPSEIEGGSINDTNTVIQRNANYSGIGTGKGHELSEGADVKRLSSQKVQRSVQKLRAIGVIKGTFKMKPQVNNDVCQDATVGERLPVVASDDNNNHSRVGEAVASGIDPYVAETKGTQNAAIAQPIPVLETSTSIQAARAIGKGTFKTKTVTAKNCKKPTNGPSVPQRDEANSRREGTDKEEFSVAQSALLRDTSLSESGVGKDIGTTPSTSADTYTSDYIPPETRTHQACADMGHTSVRHVSLSGGMQDMVYSGRESEVSRTSRDAQCAQRDADLGGNQVDRDVGHPLCDNPDTSPIVEGDSLPKVHKCVEALAADKPGSHGLDAKVPVEDSRREIGIPDWALSHESENVSLASAASSSTCEFASNIGTARVSSEDIEEDRWTESKAKPEAQSMSEAPDEGVVETKTGQDEQIGESTSTSDAGCGSEATPVDVDPVQRRKSKKSKPESNEPSPYVLVLDDVLDFKVVGFPYGQVLATFPVSVASVLAERSMEDRMADPLQPSELTVTLCQEPSIAEKRWGVEAVVTFRCAEVPATSYFTMKSPRKEEPSAKRNFKSTVNQPMKQDARSGGSKKVMPRTLDEDQSKKGSEEDARLSTTLSTTSGVDETGISMKSQMFYDPEWKLVSRKADHKSAGASAARHPRSKKDGNIFRFSSKLDERGDTSETAQQTRMDESQESITNSTLLRALSPLDSVLDSPRNQDSWLGPGSSIVPQSPGGTTSLGQFDVKYPRQSSSDVFYSYNRGGRDNPNRSAPQLDETNMTRIQSEGPSYDDGVRQKYGNIWKKSMNQLKDLSQEFSGRPSDSDDDDAITLMRKSLSKSSRSGGVKADKEFRQVLRKSLAKAGKEHFLGSDSTISPSRNVRSDAKCIAERSASIKKSSNHGGEAASIGVGAQRLPASVRLSKRKSSHGEDDRSSDKEAKRLWILVAVLNAMRQATRKDVLIGYVSAVGRAWKRRFTVLVKKYPGIILALIWLVFFFYSSE